MSTFLGKISDIVIKNIENDKLKIVFPNKRAGIFLMKEISQKIDKPVFAPDIFSIEEWVFKKTSFTKASNISLLVELFALHSEIEKVNKQSFEQFADWANILINDFDEIDKALANPNHIFNYITEAKKIKLWNEASDKKVNESYIKFFNSLIKYYKGFRNQLSKKNIAYSGMAYRYFVENIESLIDDEFVMFCGFNALNKSEIEIINHLKDLNKCSTYWDIDKYFYEGISKQNEALFYLKRSLNNLNENNINWINDEFLNYKKINVHGAAGSINQIRFTSELLENFKSKSDFIQEKTAVVLADENILIPLLGFLPDTDFQYNVTMSYQLKNTNAFGLFKAAMDVYTNPLNDFSQEDPAIYFKDFIAIAKQPILYFDQNYLYKLNSFINHIAKNNISSISKSVFDKYFSDIENLNLISRLIFPESLKSEKLINNFTALSNIIISKIYRKNADYNSLEVSSLIKLRDLILNIAELTKENNSIDNLESFKAIFTSLSNIESIPFKGEPLKGVQIMGLLETRNLEFDRVIVLSANEGYLPKTYNYQSFLLYELRKSYNLPLPKDKEDISAYYIYRLLAHAKEFHFVYNTQPAKIGSNEPSRYIQQLKYELQKYNPQIDFAESILKPEQSERLENNTEIEKTSEIIQKLEDYFKSGFSASALNLYGTCSLKFYLQKLKSIRETEILETEIQANTLGDVVHQALEVLYKPFINKILKAEDFKDIESKANKVLLDSFKDKFKYGEINKGKNLIIKNIAERMLMSVIKRDKRLVANNELVVKSTEVKDSSEFVIEINGKKLHGKLKATIDRVDSLNDNLQIIDYKTGNIKATRKFKINRDKLLENFYNNEISHDDKAFQLLFYTYFYRQKYNIQTDSQSSILSLKQNSKQIPLEYDGSDLINDSHTEEFAEIIKEMIIDILNPEKTFRKTENTDACNYCEFKDFCNR